MNVQPTPETDAAWACFKGYMEPLQDVQDLSRKLERERDDAREQLAAARAEIDEIHATGGCSYIKLHKVTAQRDRLAEALEKVYRSWNYAEVAREALQSLTHKP